VNTNDRRLAFDDLCEEADLSWSEFRRLLFTIPGALQVGAVRISLERRQEDNRRNLYSVFPFLFTDGFPEIPLEHLRLLSVASLCLLSHCIITDSLADHDPQTKCEAPDIMTNSQMLIYAWAFILRAQSKQHLQWDMFLEVYGEFNRAMVLEAERHIGNPTPYSNDDLIEVIARKSALAKIIIFKMSRLSGRFGNVEALGQSLDHWHLACNLLDDLKDWKVDLRARRFTYILTIVIEGLGGWEKINTFDDILLQESIGRYLYSSGILYEYYALILKSLDVSKRCAAEAACLRWCNYVEAFREYQQDRADHISKQLQIGGVFHVQANNVSA
jgi:hypothetical protein